MSSGAKVSSIEAIEAFRSQLILYLSKARPTLEEVSSDAMRVRLWMENEQRTHWENQLRLRRRALEEAQQALFSARLSNLRRESAAEQMTFHRARRELDEAESKLRRLKLWIRDFDNRVQPLVKQMEKLHTLYCSDLVKATAHLAHLLDSLAAYAEVSAAPPSASGPPSSPGASAPAPQTSQPPQGGDFPST